MPIFMRYPELESDNPLQEVKSSTPQFGSRNKIVQFLREQQPSSLTAEGLGYYAPAIGSQAGMNGVVAPEDKQLGSGGKTIALGGGVPQGSVPASWKDAASRSVIAPASLGSQQGFRAPLSPRTDIQPGATFGRSRAAPRASQGLPQDVRQQPQFSAPGQQYPALYRSGTNSPSWGGWAWGAAPGSRAAQAGFDWFEYGYPDRWNDTAVKELAAGGVRPFAYINLGEAHPSLFSQIGYNPSMSIPGQYSSYGERNQPMADLTSPGWQDWLVRRAGQAYAQGARGIKWDVAEPNIPYGKTRADVNAGIKSVIDRINQLYPGMNHVFNQGFSFAQQYPQLVSGIQTEGLFSSRYQGPSGSAYLQPWNDPHYWGPQFAQVQALNRQGIPVFAAEYADPYSTVGKQLYSAITGQGFVPYIVQRNPQTGYNWNMPGWGLNIQPGW